MDKQPEKLNFEDTAIAFSALSNNELNHMHNLFLLMNSQNIVNIGSKLTQWAISWHLPVQPLIKYTIYEQFCGGETLEKCDKIIAKLAQHNVGTILDYGVEAKDSENDLEKTAQYLVRTLQYAATQDNINIISSKISGLVSFDILEKVSTGTTLSSVEQTEWERGKRRVKFVCRAAFDADINIYFDAEESWIQPAIDTLVNDMMAFYNKQRPIIFNTFQLYRHDRLAYLKESYQMSVKNAYYLGAKLVRGAYLEKENERAKRYNYPTPIQPNKTATDRDYNDALVFCLDHLPQIAFCNATHNEESCQLLYQQVSTRKILRNHPHIYTAQLYGMSDHISYNMAKAGFNVVKYLPYGPVKEVVPYLLRRAKENTSVGGQISRELSLIKKERKRRGL